MTITFPRSTPDELKLVAMSFQLAPMQQLAPTRGGSQIALDLGPSLWLAEMSSGPTMGEELGIVRAWFDTLSSLNEFYAYDKIREYPVMYHETHFAGLTVGVNPFTGDCELADVTDNGLTIWLEALPIGFKLRPGDYLSFDYGTEDELRALHRVSASADADGSGNLNVEVRPRIRSGWEGASEPRTVSLYRAAAKMVVVPASLRENITPPWFGEVSFRAIQTL
jgi:hypothetical protein